MNKGSAWENHLDETPVDRIEIERNGKELEGKQSNLELRRAIKYHTLYNQTNVFSKEITLTKSPHNKVRQIPVIHAFQPTMIGIGAY